eukprot:tig00021493_g21863.t1
MSGRAQGTVLAAASGALAASSSVCMKLAVVSCAAATALCPSHPALRVVFVGTAWTCNALMWTVYAAAMQALSSTALASLVNTAANTAATGLLAWLLLGERLGALWWLGAVFMVVGLSLIEEPAADKAGAAKQA